MITRKEFRAVLEDRHRTICALNAALNALMVLEDAGPDGKTADGDDAAMVAKNQLQHGFMSYTYIQAALKED